MSIIVLRPFFILIGTTIFFFANIFAQETPPETYFYHGKNYGSEAVFNPLTTIVNGGFGILQISNRSNDLSTVDFGHGLKNVTYNLSHPLAVINQYGWSNFLKREVIPTSFQLKNAQYFPNYYNHLIGGGFTYREFVDWYKFHNFPHAKMWAVTSWFGYHLLNEVVENNQYSGPNIDPIADIYIFNTAGLLLFSFDGVARFFANTLSMRDWSFMPAYDFQLNTLENNGQNYMVRYRLPFLKRWSLMYHWGVHGMYGLTYHRENGQNFSVAGGLVVKDLVDTNSETGVRELTATLVWTGGLFYDLNNSLMTSLILSGTKGYKARLNMYPGNFSFGRFSPGFFLNLRKDNQLVFGIHFAAIPVGFGRRAK
ncbi:MAG: hypothetical protein KDH98_02945 [Calditrichaeota bacterium]|nr:hypothetical protein [Calditrichota bacterium]